MERTAWENFPQGEVGSGLPSAFREITAAWHHQENTDFRIRQTLVWTLVGPLGSVSPAVSRGYHPSWGDVVQVR